MRKLLLPVLLMWMMTGCSAQNKRDSVSLVQTSLEAHNLKDSVKEVDVSLQHNYPQGLPFEQQKEYEMLNFWQVNELLFGCEKFSKMGFLIYRTEGYKDKLLHFMPIDRLKNSKYKIIYSLMDYFIKNKIKGHLKQKFPVYDPNILLVNNDNIIYNKQNLSELSNDTLSFRYSYKLEKSRVVQEVFYLGGNSLIRKSYTYDNRARITQQNMKFEEDMPKGARLFEFVPLNSSIEVSIDSKAYYAYQYDNQNRETLAALVVNGDTLWREQYLYKGTSWHPYKLNRFVIAARTYYKQLTNHVQEWYNQYGDITKSENYDDNGKLVKTRFYDYTYDPHHNWTQCRMYLEGGPERTPKPTIVANRKITYWGEDDTK